MNAKVCTVTELNRLAKNSLESEFGRVQVEGEISDLLQHRSGHWYFTLKDESAQLRSAMFKFSNQRVKFKPENGQQVVLSGKLSIYEARGSYQFIAEQMQPAGLGQLQRAFEKLKQELAEQGLFSNENKQALPQWPNQIAIITSPQGAAIRDMQSTFERRFPAIKLLLIPVAVQGKGAAAQIAAAIDQVNTAADHCALLSNPSVSDKALSADAIIIGRGGGSLEDLWAFNEAEVAYAISRSKLPVVSAVGHETDFTIADFVADVRAATPTAAAELLSPDQQVLQQTLKRQSSKLLQATQQQLKYARLTLANLSLRVKHPGQQLMQRAQQLDYLDNRLQQALHRQLLLHKQRLNQTKQSLLHASPQASFRESNAALKNLVRRLESAVKQNLENHKRQWQSVANAMHIVSPLATLKRGYAIVQDQQGEVIRNSQTVATGQHIAAHLGSGTLHCVVEEVTCD